MEYSRPVEIEVCMRNSASSFPMADAIYYE